MKFTVRSPDGEIVFQSFGELEKAYWAGFVDPEDEVQEHGSSIWRKAGNIPVLRGVGPATRGDQQKEKLLLAFAVALATVALGALLSKGHEIARYSVAAVSIALLVMVFHRILNVTANRREAMRQPNPTGKP